MLLNNTSCIEKSMPEISDLSLKSSKTPSLLRYARGIRLHERKMSSDSVTIEHTQLLSAWTQFRPWSRLDSVQKSVLLQFANLTGQYWKGWGKSWSITILKMPAASVCEYIHEWKNWFQVAVIYEAIGFVICNYLDKCWVSGEILTHKKLMNLQD